MDIVIKKEETVEEFLARGGKITYIKSRQNANYCPYCKTWGSIEKHYYIKYHYYSTKLVMTKILKYRKCKFCYKWIEEKENKNE